MIPIGWVANEPLVAAGAVKGILQIGVGQEPIGGVSVMRAVEGIYEHIADELADIWPGQNRCRSLIDLAGGLFFLRTRSRGRDTPFGLRRCRRCW